MRLWIEVCPRMESQGVGVVTLLLFDRCWDTNCYSVASFPSYWLHYTLHRWLYCFAHGIVAYSDGGTGVTVLSDDGRGVFDRKMQTKCDINSLPMRAPSASERIRVGSCGNVQPCGFAAEPCHACQRTRQTRAATW